MVHMPMMLPMSRKKASATGGAEIQRSPPAYTSSPRTSSLARLVKVAVGVRTQAPNVVGRHRPLRRIVHEVQLRERLAVGAEEGTGRSSSASAKASSRWCERASMAAW